MQARSTVYSVSSRPHRCSCFLYPGIQKRRFHDDDTGHAAGSAAEAGHRITGCRILGVDLSSFAVMALAPATLISHDMYTLYKPNATEKQKSTLSRVIIIIIGIVSIAICNFQPAVVDMVNWCFSFGIPVFIMGVIGLGGNEAQRLLSLHLSSHGSLYVSGPPSDYRMHSDGPTSM